VSYLSRRSTTDDLPVTETLTIVGLGGSLAQTEVVHVERVAAAAVSTTGGP
jgi:hypothetical protein